MGSSVPLQGRPYGGCAILFRKSLIGSISMVSTNSKRFCAIRLSDQTGRILLIICVYLPTDYGTSFSHDEFLFVLGELEGFIHSESFDSLLIAGDFNVDFDRVGHNTTQLLTFMSDYDLIAVDRHYQSLSLMAVILSDQQLASFNCKGLSNGRPIISDLQSHDICLIQEHWLFSDHLKQLNSINSDFLSVAFGVSSMESSVPLQGRSYGGCAILFRNSLIGSISMGPPTPNGSVLYGYQIKLAAFYLLSVYISTH